MRQKDEFKQEALFNATIKLVNQIGFVSSSVAKIAKEAGVSPATVYIYYRNKEDLLVSIYEHIKSEMSQAMLVDFDPGLSFRDNLYTVWQNTFNYTSRYPEKLEYTEQFAHSPYTGLVDRDKIDQLFMPFIQVALKAMEEGVIKKVSLDLLQVFLVYPVILLSNPRVCTSFDINQASMEQAFDLAWDAVRL